MKIPNFCLSILRAVCLATPSEPNDTKKSLCLDFDYQDAFRDNMAPRPTRKNAVERLKFKDKLAKAGLSTDALLKKMKVVWTFQVGLCSG